MKELFLDCIKAFSGKNTTTNNNKTNNGEYLSVEDRIRMEEEERREREMAIMSIAIDPRESFEKPDTYKARKIDTSVFDSAETPVEFIERVSIKEEASLNITPYTGEDKVIEHVIVKEDVGNCDIAKAIVALNSDQLEALSEQIACLRRIKSKNNLTLEKIDKDVA